MIRRVGLTQLLLCAQMRSLVNNRSFLLRKALDNFLYKLLPGTWIPLYTMVGYLQHTSLICMRLVCFVCVKSAEVQIIHLNSSSPKLTQSTEHDSKKWNESFGKGLFVCFSIVNVFLEFHKTPLPPLGHIWDVKLVWWKRHINKNVSVLQYSMVCHYNGLTLIRRRHSFTPSWRRVSIIAMQSSLRLRRQQQTGYNECWTLLHESSATPRSLIRDYHDWCTRSYTGWTFPSE